MKNNWSEIQIQLGLRELSGENIPRLLHECITDLHNLETKLSDALQDINSAQKTLTKGLQCQNQK